MGACAEEDALVRVQRDCSLSKFDAQGGLRRASVVLRFVFLLAALGKNPKYLQVR